MTDPIVVRGQRKSVLRKRFREIQREHGAGAIVAFANGKSRVAQECLRGLMETGSITDPVYSREGFAVVKIVQDLDEGRSIPADELHAELGLDTGTGISGPETEYSQDTGADGADASTDGTVSEGHVDTGTDAPKLPEIPVDIKDIEPPPTSGPGSGADAWRSYAAAATSTSFEEWSKLSRAAIIDYLRTNGVGVE